MVAISQDASTDRHHLFLQIYAKLETQSKRCNTEIVFHRQWHLAWAKALDDHMQCHISLWPPRASRAVFRSVLPVYIAWVVMIAFMDADGLWLWLAALSNRRLLYDWWIVGEKVDHVRRFPSPPHPTPPRSSWSPLMQHYTTEQGWWIKNRIGSIIYSLLQTVLLVFCSHKCRHQCFSRCFHSTAFCHYAQIRWALIVQTCCKFIIWSEAENCCLGQS